MRDDVLVTADDLAATLADDEPPVLLDVRWALGRTRDEAHDRYLAGHLPGAKHIGKGVIERDVEAKIPDPAAPVVLYCGGGFRSALAADALQKMGYTNVVSMDGGWSGWVKAGNPTER